MTEENMFSPEKRAYLFLLRKIFDLFDVFNPLFTLLVDYSLNYLWKKRFIDNFFSGLEPKISNYIIQNICWLTYYLNNNKKTL